MQHPDYARILRFGTTGAINTLIGYAVILTALALGWSDIPANIAGFAVGLTTGFVLNHNWTFQSEERFRPGVIRRYMLAFALSYSANLIVMLLARTLECPAPLAHLAGIATYSICFYIGSARYVFVGPERLNANLSPLHPDVD